MDPHEPAVILAKRFNLALSTSQYTQIGSSISSRGRTTILRSGCLQTATTPYRLSTMIIGRSLATTAKGRVPVPLVRKTVKRCIPSALLSFPPSGEGALPKRIKRTHLLNRSPKKNPHSPQPKTKSLEVVLKKCSKILKILPKTPQQKI